VVDLQVPVRSLDGQPGQEQQLESLTMTLLLSTTTAPTSTAPWVHVLYRPGHYDILSCLTGHRVCWQLALTLWQPPSEYVCAPVSFGLHLTSVLVLLIVSLSRRMLGHQTGGARLHIRRMGGLMICLAAWQAWLKTAFWHKPVEIFTA
jgi:hypothetical protein